MKKRSASTPLPGGDQAAVEEAAIAVAARNLLDMGKKRFPDHRADADEPRDMVELRGFSEVPDTVVAPLAGCAGCWLHTSNCEGCSFDRPAFEEDSGEDLRMEDALARAIIHERTDPRQQFDVFEQYTSSARGVRAVAIMKRG